MGWLKFDTATHEKPEVLAITVRMGWDDPDLTVGKLLRVWRWFDQHTTDGNAPSVTPALLDRIVGVAGLTQAMVDVGWMRVDGAGLVLPNFARHNGATAKSRALTAARVANFRAGTGTCDADGTSNGSSVTGALAREEKRREEKKRGEASGMRESVGRDKRAPTTRGTRLPADWKLPMAWGEWALEEFPGWTTETVRKVAADFKDHWIAETGSKATKADWLATWRKWCRSDITQRSTAPQSRGGMSSDPAHRNGTSYGERKDAEAINAAHLIGAIRPARKPEPETFDVIPRIA